MAKEIVDIITDLKDVQTFIKEDREFCPDYSVTKNIYIHQIQNVIDKYTIKQKENET